MQANTKNVFLNRVCTELRRSRPPETRNYNFRVEYGDGNPYAILWFRTRGCKYDHRGECTMCNYGASTEVSVQKMVEHVNEALSSWSLRDRTGATLLVSPSGCMFDEWEVPVEAREGIFELVRNTPCTTFICETRVENVQEDRIKRYVEILNNKTCCVEMGLESADPWILKYCINKSLLLNYFGDALRLLKQHRVTSIANILLGSAFLSTSEAIEDTVRSVRWAFAQGFDTCVVFPAHVKQWTLLKRLWEDGWYQPPSLWSLVEVLVRLGPEYIPRTTIAWYKVYHELEGVEENILQSPTTCPACYNQVIQLLDVYSNTNDFQTIQQLHALECECKTAWRSQLLEQQLVPLKERVMLAYEHIGQDVLGAAWWEQHGPRIIDDVIASHAPVFNG